MISNPRGDDVATCKMGGSDEQQTRRLQFAGWWEPAQCRQTTCPWARTQELPRAEQGIERPGGSNRKRRRCHTTPAHTKNSEIGLASEKVMAVGDKEAQSHNMPSPITRDKP